MKYCIKLSMTLIIIAALNSTAAFAALYKSIDEDGNVSYTQSPPKTGTYTTIKVKKFKPASSGVAKKTMDARKSIEEGAEARKKNKLVKTELAKNKKIQQQNCKSAKNNLRLFTVYRKLKDEKGEYYRVTDTEKAKRIKTAKENIKQFCN